MAQAHGTVKVRLSPAEASGYISFLRRVLVDSYGGRVAYAIEGARGGKACLTAALRFGGSLVELEVVAEEEPGYYIRYDARAVPRSAVTLLEHLIESATYIYAETKGMGVLYYVIVPGLDVAPPRGESLRYRVVTKLLTGNLVFVFAISLLVYCVAWSLFRHYAPLALVATQLAATLLSGRIVAAMGDWEITSEHPTVCLIGVRLPLDAYERALRSVLYPKRREIKARLRDELLTRGYVSPERVTEVLAEYGVVVRPLDVTVSEVDLYRAASDVFSSYRLPVPRVVLSNVALPNAAASGVSPGGAVLLVTSGLLVRLTPEELRAVLAHEASHIRHRDAVTLSALIIAEYVVRVYVLLNYAWLFNIITELLYLYASLTALFFVAKFIEARADVEAAAVLGSPDPLISALRKLGSRRLAREARSSRLLQWLSWNPHPPLSFRIERLEELRGGVRGLWREAVAGCLSDFARSLAAAMSPR
mgnify:CR=1 FL=1